MMQLQHLLTTDWYSFFLKYWHLTILSSTDNLLRQITHKTMARDCPNGTWWPLGRLLSTTPTKVTLFCNVYISTTVDIFHVLLILQLIKLIPITMDLSNLVWLPWIQSMNILQQFKYPVIHEIYPGIDPMGLCAPLYDSYI